MTANKFAIQGWGAPGKAWTQDIAPPPQTVGRRAAKLIAIELAEKLRAEPIEWLSDTNAAAVSRKYGVRYARALRALNLARTAAAREAALLAMGKRKPEVSIAPRLKTHCKRWQRTDDKRSKAEHSRPLCNGSRAGKEAWVDPASFRETFPADQCKQCRAELDRLDRLARFGYPNAQPPRE